jgi:dihydropteroate synthase
MKTLLFGILNYTPDSFFDGGKNFAVEAAITAAQKLLDNGASYIDIGAEATNPFVGAITAKEEIERLSPILPTLFERFPDQISLDTYHSETLKWALQFGKPTLNDVSGVADPRMVNLVAKHELTCIVGHLPPEAKGIPVNSHNYKMDDFNQVVAQLLYRAQELQTAGITKEQIILDPNIGFGKTMKLNWQLVKKFATSVSYPVMIGTSHKRFLGYDEHGKGLIAGQELRHTKEQNLLAAQYALSSGTQYLRVHEPHWYRNLV